jgi:hypothetical protein
MRGKSFRRKVSSAKVTPFYPRKGRQRGMKSLPAARAERLLSDQLADLYRSPAPTKMRAGKLRVEHLPLGADVSIADEAFFGINFDHTLRQTYPLDQQETGKFAETLEF